MPHPIKRRTVTTYARDVEGLGRLRSAILMDVTVTDTRRVEVVGQIDILIELLSAVIRDLRSKES